MAGRGGMGQQADRLGVFLALALINHKSDLDNPQNARLVQHGGG